MIFTWLCGDDENSPKNKTPISFIRFLLNMMKTRRIKLLRKTTSLPKTQEITKNSILMLYTEKIMKLCEQKCEKISLLALENYYLFH